MVDTKNEMTNNLGTTFWMAPEVFQTGKYDESGNLFFNNIKEFILIVN